MTMDLGDGSIRALRVLGEGTFGRVFLCTERAGPVERKVCVKRIIVRNPKFELPLIKDEIYIISQLRHPLIVQFLRSYMHSGTFNIVMEFIPNGTIRDVISSHPNGLKSSQLLRYFSDMLIGLEYLHIRHVIHRDIKPENMLIDSNHRIKYADFGIATLHNNTSTTKQANQPSTLGTPLYMAPEIMCGNKFCFKSDIWSLGCVLFELCVGRHPFTLLLPPTASTTKDVHDVIRKVARPKLNCQLMRNKHYNPHPNWAQMGEQMLIYDPNHRALLPDLLRIDPTITLTVYEKYFNYDY